MKENNNHQPGGSKISRRDLLKAGAVLGGMSLLPAFSAAATLTSNVQSSASSPLRRKLGNLEVSPVGLGCQWLPTSKQGVVTDFYASRITRPEAINLIRSAVDMRPDNVV